MWENKKSDIGKVRLQLALEVEPSLLNFVYLDKYYGIIKELFNIFILFTYVNCNIIFLELAHIVIHQLSGSTHKSLKNMIIK